MSAVNEMIDRFRSRAGETTSLEGLISEACVCMGDLLAVLEKPDTHDAEEVAALRSIAEALNKPEPDDKLMLAALRFIAEAIKSLQLKAPDIQVNVPPTQVVIMPAADKPPHGWKIRITGRDGNGGIRDVSMTPDT